MITVEPLTPARWDDFASLCRQMGPNRSCWCMWWRRSPAAPPPPGSAQQRARALVAGSPRPVGLLAYEDATPVGWVAVAPRDEYPRLNGGRDTAPVGDDAPGTWAIPCFFVIESHRGRAIAHALLRAAVAFAAAQGATAVDGVPRPPASPRRSASAAYTGSTSMFEAAGFVEAARRSPRGRVLMRRDLRAPKR